MGKTNIDENVARDVLHDAMSMWWLRPENGLAIASYTLRGVDFAAFASSGASADFACGDGFNTFFKCGGRLDFYADLFENAVDPADSSKIIDGKIDVFDYFDQDFSPNIKKYAPIGFTYGTDHKKNLLKKAEFLKIYQKTIHESLSFESSIAEESLSFAYCNSLYWVPNSEDALGFLTKTLKSGGVLVLDVMTEARENFRLKNLLPTAPPALQAILERNRDQNNPGFRTLEQWRESFVRTGFVIEDERDILPVALGHIWNIGSRPLFPALKLMTDSLPPEARPEAKREWVNAIVDLFLPILLEPETILDGPTPARMQFVVRKV